MPTGELDPSDTLARLNPARCLIVIPCSASKRKGGRPGAPTPAPPLLAGPRHTVLARPDSHIDETLVMPACQRYTGHLYRSAESVLPELAMTGRLIILSGGYGVLEGDDLIGAYNRLLRPGDWPRGLLEHLLAERAARAAVDVVAFAGTTTSYARILRRTQWRLGHGHTAHLVTLGGVRGVSAVSNLLGLALRAFVEATHKYPEGTAVERLQA